MRTQTPVERSGTARASSPPHRMGHYRKSSPIDSVPHTPPAPIHFSPRRDWTPTANHARQIAAAPDPPVRIAAQLRGRATAGSCGAGPRASFGPAFLKGAARPRMRNTMRMSRAAGLPITLGLLWSACQIAYAHSMQHYVSAISGQPTHIWNFFNCRTHFPMGTTGSFVEHGTVTVKELSTQNRCGNANEPAREVWYTSPPGFKGIDTITFPAGSGRVIFEVTVQ
jgi:hypothetical protein